MVKNVLVARSVTTTEKYALARVGSVLHKEFVSHLLMVIFLGFFSRFFAKFSRVCFALLFQRLRVLIG